MSQVSKFLRKARDDKGGEYLTYYCQGCKDAHQVKVVAGGYTGPCWRWNGNVDSPTFEPSVLVTYGANPDADEEFKEWRTKRTCHTFIKNGQVQFLSDCTHEFAGQTLALPELPPYMQSDRWSDGGE